MSQEILESVRSIEQAAQQMKDDYRNRISVLEAQSEQKISEAKRNVAIVLDDYERELRDKNAQKSAEFQEELRQSQEREVAALTERFLAKKQDLVQETVKEVLKRYGNR